MERQARHLRFIFVLCGLFFLSGTGRVVASEDKAGLVLRPLRDRGGIERGLNRRLTDALKKFLGEHSDFLSKTEISERKIEDAPLTPSCYILTGEISFARAQSESEGRYFLVLRLFRGESRRTLVGQWAGNLRFVSVSDGEFAADRSPSPLRTDRRVGNARSRNPESRLESPGTTLALVACSGEEWRTARDIAVGRGVSGGVARVQSRIGVPAHVRRDG